MADHLMIMPIDPAHRLRSTLRVSVLIGLTLSLLIPWLIGCQAEEKITMTSRPDLQQRLDALDAKDRKGREALTDSLRGETYAPAEELAKYWRRNKGQPGQLNPQGDKALFILQNLGPAAYPPLMAVLDTVSPEDKLFVLEDLIDRHAQQRREMAAQVEALLDDKSLVISSGAGGGMEEKPPERRICDEGYLLLRRLLHVTESEKEGAEAAWRFLRLEEKQKDEAITKARTSREWQGFAGHEESP